MERKNAIKCLAIAIIATVLIVSTPQLNLNLSDVVYGKPKTAQITYIGTVTTGIGDCYEYEVRDDTDGISGLRSFKWDGVHLKWVSEAIMYTVDMVLGPTDNIQWTSHPNPVRFRVLANHMDDHDHKIEVYDSTSEFDSSWKFPWDYPKAPELYLNPLPEPWIVEPSILDPEAPRHNETIVIWGDSINVSAVELKSEEDIENTTFEYSSNGIGWELIGISFEGIREWENWTDIYGNPIRGFKMWSVTWNTSGINEGLYWIRATMVDTIGQIGQDNITAYFDPIPPIPEFTLPWGVTVNGTIQISVETNATDILYTQFESLKVSTEYKDVQVVRVPDASCVWNSIAALLKYWANRPSHDDPTKKPPLHKLIEDGQEKEMTDDKLIQELIDEYNRQRGILDKPRDPNYKTKKHGLDRDEIAFTLNIWLAKQLGEKFPQLKEWRRVLGYKGWVFGPPEVSFNSIKEEFEKGPVIIMIKRRPDEVAHAMVVKKIDNKPVEIVDPGTPREERRYRIELMDDYLAKVKNGDVYRSILMDDGGAIKMDWREDGLDPTTDPKDSKPDPDDWDDWHTYVKLQILPDKEILKDLCLSRNWTQQGMDDNGTDGWSLALDTTQLEEGYHFLRATMVDSSGSNGTQTTEIFVDNIPPIPGDHDIAITNLTASRTNITVTVENQGRYNETTYLSVSYGGTLRVDLTSGANATLTFEWAPSPGQYNITAEVDPVLDEIDISDNTKSIILHIPPLSVSISPLSASILVGQSVTFASTVSGGYNPYSYQWYLNANPVSGATSNTWTFTPSTSGIYYIYLKVTDAMGNTTQSSTARITVAAIPVGGYSIPIQAPTTAKPLTPYLILTAILTIAFTTIKRKTKGKTKHPP